VRGRVWRVTDFTPRWSLVTGLLDGRRPAGVKLGPALPHDLVPPDAEAEWLTDRGDTVEVGLWAGPGSLPGRRSALVRADDQWHRLVTDPDAPPLLVRAVGGYVFEPVGAVIRSGGLAQLGASLGAGLLDPHLAYLTGDAAAATPFATAYAVRAALPFDRRALRHWVAEQQVGGSRSSSAAPRSTRPGSPRAASEGAQRGDVRRLPDPVGAAVLVVDRLR
jgi:hypothetical protein